MRLGSVQIDTPIILAPMAGVSDEPFRNICLNHGADLAVHEMVSAKSDLRSSRKSTQRLKSTNHDAIRWVQIVGADPETMADGAQFNEHQGADIIDINMGCPAKKVCRKAAGSALLSDPGLVEDILVATVEAVQVPVTLKIRTGVDADSINAPQIAKIAQRVGIQSLSVHGRTRSDKFKGDAEYKTIREVRQAVDINIIANGDIDSPEKAKHVLNVTEANGLMLGRAAYGNPWIFEQIKSYLNCGSYRSEPDYNQAIISIQSHIKEIHRHYGDILGVRIARKHIGWYLERFVLSQFRKQINKIESGEMQLLELNRIFSDFALQKAS